MKGDVPYRKGQRWEFSPTVAEFESTLVIAQVYEADTRWQKETEYECYVRYSPAATKWIPSDYDGVMLVLNEAGLDRSVTALVKSNVRLPWWHVYGRRFDKKSDAPNSMFRHKCDRANASLKGLFNDAKKAAERIRERAVLLEKHLLEYKSKPKHPPKSKSLAESWKRIIAWSKKHGRPFRLNKGASKKAIAAFEQTIGSSLPDDFKESLLLHDGGATDSCWIHPYHGDLLSLEQILKQWTMYREWQLNGTYATGEDWPAEDIVGPIKPIFWNTKRIHITDNSGDHLTLDLDPPKKGTYGQLIDHSHEVGPTRVVAKCWSDFLSQLVHDLETGKYIQTEDGDLELLGVDEDD